MVEESEGLKVYERKMNCRRPWPCCDVCGKSRGRWYCKADEAYLCDRCDGLVHSANAVAQRHRRVAVNGAVSAKIWKQKRDSAVPLSVEGDGDMRQSILCPESSDRGANTVKIWGRKRDLAVPFSVEEEDMHQSVLNVETESIHREADYSVKIQRWKRDSAVPFSVEEEEEEEEEEDTHRSVPDAEMESIDRQANYSAKIQRRKRDLGPLFSVEDKEGKGVHQSVIDVKMETPSKTVKQEYEEETCGATVPQNDAVGCEEESIIDNHPQQSLSDKQSVAACSSVMDTFDIMDWCNNRDLAEEIEVGEDCNSSTDHVYTSIVPDLWHVGPRNNHSIYPFKGKGEREEEDNRVSTSTALSLKLNYEDVLNEWSNRGSLWSCKIAPTVPDIFAFQEHIMTLVREEQEVPVMGHPVGRTDSAARMARVMRYREKRRTRLFVKKIRYEVRKLNAEKRPRMKGRFIKRVKCNE